MRLKVKIGLADTKEVNYYQNIDYFPRLIKHIGKNYEFVFYDDDKTGFYDKIIVFGEVPYYDPNYSVDCKSWYDIFPEVVYGCECGAKHTSFPEFHMKYCRLWSKW